MEIRHAMYGQQVPICSYIHGLGGCDFDPHQVEIMLTAGKDTVVGGATGCMKVVTTIFPSSATPVGAHTSAAPAGSLVLYAISKDDYLIVELSPSALFFGNGRPTDPEPAMINSSPQ